MHPNVFKDYVEPRREFGDVSLLPTSSFFYGLQDREEIALDLAKGAPLFSIEAMKMETVVSADQDDTVKVAHVKPGEKLQAKDLVIEYD